MGKGEEKIKPIVSESELKELLCSLSDYVYTLKCKAKGYRRAERDAKTAAEIYELEAMELEMKVDALIKEMRA